MARNIEIQLNDESRIEITPESVAFYDSLWGEIAYWDRAQWEADPKEAQRILDLLTMALSDDSLSVVKTNIRKANAKRRVHDDRRRD